MAKVRRSNRFPSCSSIAEHPVDNRATQEHYLPGRVIDRANRSRWLEEGGLSLHQRAQKEVVRLVASYQPPDLPGAVRTELTRLMEHEARRYGMDRLPHAAS